MFCPKLNLPIQAYVDLTESHHSNGFRDLSDRCIGQVTSWPWLCLQRGFKKASEGTDSTVSFPKPSFRSDSLDDDWPPKVPEQLGPRASTAPPGNRYTPPPPPTHAPRTARLPCEYLSVRVEKCCV